MTQSNDRINETLKLSLEDSTAFVDALLNPPLPNNALKAAALRYEQTMRAIAEVSIPNRDLV